MLRQCQNVALADSCPSLTLDPEAVENISKAEVFPDLGGNAWEAITDKICFIIKVSFSCFLFCF